MLYYVYCVEMGRSDEEFYNATLAKVITLMDLHSQFKTGKVDRLSDNEVQITSMRQIEGFI